MQLNLPIAHLTEDSENILIAGAGGGFDIYSGLPLYFHFHNQGKKVHLANYSFVDFQFAKMAGESCEKSRPYLSAQKAR